MSERRHPTFTSFSGTRQIASGPLLVNALALRQAADARTADPLLLFDDQTGRNIDIDLRGTDSELVARFEEPASAATSPDSESETRGRGRPKMGVVSREVTLLPRHWDWLNSQPGGASVTLRRLVDDARRTHADKDRLRAAQARAYQFMQAMAGDLPNFEAATRALFANDLEQVRALLTAWPHDVARHALKLADAAA
ncbi:DUF2239 domain-containing protein [Ahniella affigens]|uniref:DUF2239 domain-containing protein n=1 Tax=Ahniella affigens TaxID=2021234 RepID=A0A2P1PTN8_9GAMM|nr:DUF2239 family protein [Ahniella affigens]AVP98190.1 DUF2239 domain-containing protein [Ahniella affigens]